MKKYIFFVIGIVCPAILLKAQQLPTAKTLSMGDTVPNLSLGELYDPVTNATKKVKISAFPNRLIILDFWNTGCAACINAWSKLEKLQAMYKGQVKIILVNTYEDISRIKQLLAKRLKISGSQLQLPIAYNNAELKNYFHYNSVPHYVWIDSNSVIRSITSSDQLTRDNLERAIQNDFSSIEQKVTNKINFDPSQSFFEQRLSEYPGSVVYSSILSKANPKFTYAEGILKDSAGKVSIFFINNAIKPLYQLAYKGEYFSSYPNSRTVLEVADTTQYVSEVNAKINWPNLYCYQLVMKNNSDDLKPMYEKMIDDLNKAFSMEAKIEKRIKKCLVLYAKDTSLIGTIKGDENITYSSYHLNMQHSTISKFMLLLNNVFFYSSPYPFINEIECNGPINLNIEASMFNLESVNAALHKYRMGLKLEEREIEVLVIRNALHR